VILTVELIYDFDCPNVNDTRAQLLRAFAETGLSPCWQEWDRNAPESPLQMRAYGSPTILVNGQDVTDTFLPTDADCCRLYTDDGGTLRGVPAVAAIVSALLRTKGPTSSSIAGQEVKSMSNKRTIEVFSAGCSACEEMIELINRVVCPSCEVLVLDMKDLTVANRAKGLGIRSVPAVVIDGKLADCCTGRGPDELTLRAAGLGQPI
jgi:hypothetical protein